MGLYTTKGLYNGYDKNHKERDKTDYYATPTEEVKNILKELEINFNNTKILEPCAGGGHMLRGIREYCQENSQSATIFATDFHSHPGDDSILVGADYDFLSDNYGGEILDDLKNIDWVIMNPPFATIVPFALRSLEIANKGVIMFARLQFLESKSRYETIFSENPPTEVYVYVDRIQCWKDGIKPEGSSAQAYAWFIWDKSKSQNTEIHWIRSAK